MLKNPGFEGGYYEQDGQGELKVGDGWVAWYVDEGDTIHNRRPEYNLVTESRRVRSGEKAQQYGIVWATHWAGIYQRVEGIPIGAKLSFSIWGYVFGVRGDQNAGHPGNLHLKIGIDPTGGTDPHASTVVWSDEVGDYRDGFAYTEGDDEPWYLFVVDAVAEAEAVTVFTHSNPEWPLNNMAAQWDDARLELVGGALLMWKPWEPVTGDWLTIDAISPYGLTNVKLNITRPDGTHLPVSEVTLSRYGDMYMWTWATDPLDDAGTYGLAFTADGVEVLDLLECKREARGLPRVDYSRTYLLLSPNADAELADKVAAWTWDRYRWTIGASADDAGLGTLSKRRVIAIDPGDWPGDLADFFAKWYPGTEVHLVDSENDFQLRGRILAIGARGEGLSLAYPTTHLPPRITDGGKFGVWRGTYYHNGLDLASSYAAWGDQILCAFGGEVIVAGVNPDEKWFGWQVRTRTQFGDREILVRYAHFVEGCVYVEAGDEVTAGEALGKPDNTGESTGDHLHLDVRVMDPLYPDERLYLDPALLIQWPSEQEPQGAFNPVGVHGAPIPFPSPPDSWAFWLNELQELGVGTYKMLYVNDDPIGSSGLTNLDWIRALVDAGIRPVVRLYQAEQFPGRLNPELLDEVPKLVAAGAVYIEGGNEPNLTAEWKAEYKAALTWQNQGLVDAVAESMWLDMLEIVERGGKPAIYAMAPTDRGGVNQQYSSVEWLSKILWWVASRHGKAMENLLEEGKVWLAVHSSPFSRPLDFEPNDPPDDMCARGYEVYRQIVEEFFGMWPETIATEGGAYSPEHLEYLGWDGYSEEAWAALTVEHFEWLQERGDLACCTWILSDEGVGDERWKRNGWYVGCEPRPVVTMMKEWQNS